MTPKVLILGAGIGGPALALGLKRRGIDSVIYELRSERITTGGSITLAANALRSLSFEAGEDIYHKIKENGFVFDRMGMYGEDGYKYGEALVGKGDFPAVRIMRTKLNELLTDTCKDQGIKIHYGKKTTEIVENDKGVELKFEDGSSAQGDILFGVDGIHSKAREYILGSENPKTYFSGRCGVNGFVPRNKVQTSNITFPAVLINPSGFLMVQPINPDGQVLAWGITTRVEQDKTADEWREFRLSGEAARQAKENYKDIKTATIRSLLDNVKDEECQLWAPHGLPHLPRWHAGKVCLLGDAAHAFPPNGQGTAMAFEDGAILCRLLADSKSLDKGYEAIFTKFESIRRPRVEEVQKITGQMVGAVAQKTDPNSWKWTMKQWGIWAYMTVWKRGLMGGEAYLDYDVATEEVSM